VLSATGSPVSTLPIFAQKLLCDAVDSLIILSDEEPIATQSIGKTSEYRPTVIMKYHLGHTVVVVWVSVHRHLRHDAVSSLCGREELSSDM